MNKLFADKARLLLKAVDLRLTEIGLGGPPLLLGGLSGSWKPGSVEAPYFKAPKTIWIYGDFSYSDVAWARMQDRILDCAAHCAVYREFAKQQELFRTSPLASRSVRPTGLFHNSLKWAKYRNEFTGISV